MRLVVKSARTDDGPAGGGARWAVEIGATPIVIGRDAACDLPLADDTNISRHHVVCHAAGGRLHIRDLGSRNGTYLNGAKVIDAVMLAGDEITIGGYRLRLETAAAAIPPTVVGATFTTSGTEHGVAAVAGLGPSSAAAGDGGAGGRSRQFGTLGALATTVVLLGLAGAVIPLVRGWREGPGGPSAPSPRTAPDAWRAAWRGDAAGAAVLMADPQTPADRAVRDWIHAGGGLPVDRPGVAQEIPPLERLTTLPPGAIPPGMRHTAFARLARARLEQRAGAAARRAIEFEASGDPEAAIAAFEELGAWPETGAAKRHLGRAATLRSRRCVQFRELGASNRAAGDWDGALRCFRTAARHARGAQTSAVAADLREAEREVQATVAIAAARSAAGAGEWGRGVAALEGAPPGTSQAGRITALREELRRRLALQDAWAAYTSGDSARARGLLDRWRAIGDAEATALWRRAGAAEDAFREADRALAQRRWEAAREGWTTLLQIESDDRVAWRRRAQTRLEQWPVARVVAELRSDGLAAIEEHDFDAARSFLDRADALDPVAVAADLDALRTRAQLLYNTALNLERTDPDGARLLYRRVAAMTRPGESKHAAARAAIERLGR